MVSKELQIGNSRPIHFTPALMLSKTAMGFSADIVIEKGGMRVNAKNSVITLTLFFYSRGEWITVDADGEDEEDAISAIEALIADRFGEDE